MRRSQYLAFLDERFEREFGPKLQELRKINQLALTGRISEEERLMLHEALFPGFAHTTCETALATSEAG
jgi:hypothetical protein